MSNEREEIAKENGMSMEFVNWFFDNKKDTCGYLWLPMLAAMWEGWKVREQQLAESRSKLEKLAAENARLLEFIKDDCWIYETEVERNRDAHDYAPQTPATSAFLAEVRASATPDEATERELFEGWVMENYCISKSTLEGLRTCDGYRNSTLSGKDYNGMWLQWKAIRAAQLRQGGVV